MAIAVEFSVLIVAWATMGCLPAPKKANLQTEINFKSILELSGIGLNVEKFKMKQIRK